MRFGINTLVNETIRKNIPKKFVMSRYNGKIAVRKSFIWNEDNDIKIKKTEEDKH